jgi:hypothetical protein
MCSRAIRLCARLMRFRAIFRPDQNGAAAQIVDFKSCLRAELFVLRQTEVCPGSNVVSQHP